jgi:O-antigen ligase
VTILAPTFYVFQMEKSRWIRGFALIALALELAALVMTHNRTGLLGILLVVALLIASRMLRITTPVVVLLALFLTLAAIALPRSYVERVLSWKHQRQSASIATRWDLQVNGLGVFLNHWLLGVGQGNFGAAFMQTNSEAAAEAYWLTEVAKTDYHVHEMGAHNMYLEVAIETGVIGLALLLIFLGMGISEARTTVRLAAEAEAPTMANLAKVVEISLIAFCVIALFLHAQEQKIWWILMGVSVAMRRMVPERPEGQAIAAQATPN